MASATFLLFAVTSIPSACFCAFIAGNSFSTMIPGVKRISSMMAGVTVAIALAVTGVAENLIGFFTIVGASFGPICGAMAADYFLSGGKWAGPREGISVPGYGAWALGFLVGILPFLPVSDELKSMAQPAVVYSSLLDLSSTLCWPKPVWSLAPSRCRCLRRDGKLVPEQACNWPSARVS